VTNDAGAAEIPLVGQVEIAPRPNAPTEVGRDFVITQINVRAASGAIRRRRLVADFGFAFALETGDDAVALTAPDIFEFTMKRSCLCDPGFGLRFQRRRRK
jgi:hypothetical protein